MGTRGHCSVRDEQSRRRPRHLSHRLLQPSSLKDSISRDKRADSPRIRPVKSSSLEQTLAFAWPSSYRRSRVSARLSGRDLSCPPISRCCQRRVPCSAGGRAVGIRLTTKRASEPPLFVRSAGRKENHFPLRMNLSVLAEKGNAHAKYLRFLFLIRPAQIFPARSQRPIAAAK